MIWKSSDSTRSQSAADLKYCRDHPVSPEIQIDVHEGYVA